MLIGLVLIEGQNIDGEALRSASLDNAKQLVVGYASEFGVILHIAAESPVYFDKALQTFAQVPGVTGLLTLALRTTQ